MFFRQKLEISKFLTEAIVTGSRLRAARESFSMSCDFLAIVSLLSNSWKTHVFNFYVADVTGFQTLSFPPLNLSWTTLQPKTYFSSKPHQFWVYFCKLSSRYEFLILSFIIFLRLGRNFSLGFWNLGVFENWVGVHSFVKIFQHLWLDWVPFDDWDVALIRCTFLPHEAEAILSIPISPMNPSDSQIWVKSPNGMVTVKSAYIIASKYLVDTKGREESPGCFDNSKMTTIWKVI